MTYILSLRGKWHALRESPQGLMPLCGNTRIGDIADEAEALPEGAVLCGTCRRALLAERAN